MLRGLPFNKGGRLMVEALREIFFIRSSFCLNLLLLGCLWLLLLLWFELE
jgi:hypothetical protein